MFKLNRKKIAKDFAKSLSLSDEDEIILFGSVAREEDTDESDIDILIVSDNKSNI